MTSDPGTRNGRRTAREGNGQRKPERSGLRRRSRATEGEKLVVLGVLGVGAVLGALGPGEPTGHAVVDVIYRAVFVAVLALAASRARRWSLIMSSALAAMGSLGLGLVLGAVALVMSVFLVGRDLRSRPYAATVGALVGLALLRLEIGAFLGASAVLALVSGGLILFSGYRVSHRRTKRIVRWTVAGVTALFVVGIAMAVYQAISFSSPLQAAVQSTVDGVQSVQDGDTGSGGRSFRRATRQFGEVAGDASQWWLFPSRLVPVVAQNVEVISVMSDAGADLTSSAARLSEDVDYGRIRREGGGVDLGVLAEFRDPVDEAARRLADARTAVDELESPWVVGPLDDRIDDFARRVDELRSQTDLAAAALRYGPTMFGAEGERRYLVLIGNPAELRDLGGHIGNWAELSMTDGSISLVDVGGPLELSQPRLDGALAETEALPPSVLAMRPATFPQNWGASINFPLDAALAARLYQAKVGRSIDGVLYADPYAFAAFLRITGAVPVPGLAGRTVDASTAVDFLTLDQYTAFADEGAGNENVTQLVREVFDRLTRTTLPSPAELGAMFGDLVREGRFRLVSTHSEDHQLLGLVGLDQSFEPTPGHDVLAVVGRNANPSKIDSFLRRSVDYEVEWDPESGIVRARVTVELRNEAPASGLGNLVLGNTAGEPLGTNITDVAVISPFEVDRATVDGVDAPVSPIRDEAVWRHTVRVAIPPGGTTKVVLDLEGEVDPGRTYRLRFGGQPMVVAGDVDVSVSAQNASIRPGPGITVRRGTASATLSGVEQTELTLRAEPR